MKKITTPTRQKGKFSPEKASENGMILPTLLIVMFVLMVVGLSLATQAMLHLDNTKRDVHNSNSLLAAETGAELTLHELNKDSSFSGFSETEFYDTASKGRATYQTTVTDGALKNEKIITSTGHIYAEPGNEATVTRRVRLVVVGTTSGDYVVHTGPGGLIMTNTATIANGEVHVNGYLDMSNTAQIGTELTPTTVNVAHIFCPEPPDSTFPKQCSSGEPIDMQNKAHIYGEVYATNQTDGSQMSNPGLIENSTASEVSLPDYDRRAQKNSVTTTISSDWSCKGQDEETWADGLKIEGNVTIRGKCQVTLGGDVWITGDMTMRNSSSLVINDTATEKPVIMIDGSGGLKIRNSAAVVTNADGVGAKFITFYAKASCSPGCSDLSGTDLYDSQSYPTISIRNSSLAAGSTFYARWSRVKVDNSGSIGAVLGQSVILSNTGTISLGEDLSSGDKVWTIQNYQQVYK